MHMMPQAIRARELDIFEPVRGIPLVDVRFPTQCNAVPTESVEDVRTACQLNEFGIDYRKLHPGRREQFEISRVGEKREYLFNGNWKPLLALDQVDLAH